MDSLEEFPAWDNSSEKNVTTAKIQAINLLFADFLMNQNNLFTLQEFVMEVGNLLNFTSSLFELCLQLTK